MIKLYFYRLNKFLDDLANEPRNIKSKAISKKAYELLQAKLCEYTGQRLNILKTDRGKPYIENSSLCVSISHSDNAILLAISDNQIGVDTECPRQFSEHASKRLFSKTECDYIVHGEESLRATTLWTMREAICKATGEGFSNWFFDCELVQDSDNVLELFEHNALLLNLKNFIIDNNICTVAAVSSIDDIEFFDCEL